LLWGLVWKYLLPGMLNPSPATWLGFQPLLHMRVTFLIYRICQMSVE
jgi:hypothetical protein